mmetsp:Transcript_35847/g.48135  ORF Transcript_35847/g.48135 Transcript_35847/m.48135 type:complete len:81 (+) Transcript_35847:3-245(+)
MSILEVLFLIGDISREFSMSSINLSSLVEGLFHGDGIDHTCHAIGLLSGVIISAAVQIVARRRSQNSCQNEQRQNQRIER